MDEDAYALAHEDGYLSALRDLKIVHQQWIDDGCGFEDAQAHRQAIRFLDGLIAMKEARMARRQASRSRDPD